MNVIKDFKFALLLIFSTFCAIALTIPTADARGSGHHGGHSGFGSHGGHGHFGGGHRHFGGGHRHFGGHRSHFRGFARHRHSYRRSYNYYPRSYGYSYRPRYSSRAYSYAPRNYSPRPYTSYSTRPPLSTSYISINTSPNNYAGSTNPYNDSAGVRYIEKDMESKVTNNAGWHLLAQHKAREALDFFAGQAGRYQNDGVPKAGYALSTAMKGDLDRAAWAMRRAFRIDPSSLHYINVEQPLRISINKLIAKYNTRLNYANGNRHTDSAFMIAALSYLLHNESAARRAIDVAMNDAGDNSESAQNLYNLVNTEQL